MEEIMEALDEAWDDESGFLGKLRSGEFDPEAGEAYAALLSSIPPIGETVDSTLVRLIWFAPLFIEWQIERATSSESEAAQLKRISDQVQEAVTDVLGIP